MEDCGFVFFFFHFSIALSKCSKVPWLISGSARSSSFPILWERGDPDLADLLRYSTCVVSIGIINLFELYYLPIIICLKCGYSSPPIVHTFLRSSTWVSLERIMHLSLFASSKYEYSDSGVILTVLNWFLVMFS